ncbi:hypothetical protein M758_12G035000 [Ceratodon purpureus]|nr:hypothetical protein M758_12G035000 [Ceratodon purpureus]
MHTMAAATLSCACTLCPLKTNVCSFRLAPSQGVVSVKVGGLRIRCAAGGDAKAGGDFRVARGSDGSQLQLGFSGGATSVVLEQLSGDLQEELGAGDGGAASSSDSSVNSKENLRRERISHSNKGKVPWNKGRRHSPETIKKIKERTKLAMRNPEIRDKLRQCGKNQSKETKAKIRKKMVGFWESKRLIKQAQDFYVCNWKQVIAEAARVGGPEDEEYEWDSYKNIKEQYRLEELQAGRRAREALRATQKVERAKKKPITDSHRKAISDAIRAKWADPTYQRKVSAGMARIDAERRRKRTEVKRERFIETSKKKATIPKPPKAEVVAEEIQVEKKKHLQAPPVDQDFIAEVLAEEVTLQTRSERSTAARIKGPRKVTLVSLEDHDLSSEDVNETAAEDKNAEQEVAASLEGRMPSKETDVKTPTLRSESVQLSSKLTSQSHKDPFVLEKVQRIQQLRKGRLEVELKRKEAADRARMLIADAERAASALEQAGTTDAATMAKLIETRKLLAEATRSMQAAERKQVTSLGKSRNLEIQENEKLRSLSTSSDFHSRIWTTGDNLADCPHPIPIRIGSRGSKEHQLHLGLGGNLSSSSSMSSRWATSPSDLIEDILEEKTQSSKASDTEGSQTRSTEESQNSTER